MSSPNGFCQDTMQPLTESNEGKPQIPPPKGNSRTARKEAGDSRTLLAEDQQATESSFLNDTLRFPPEGFQPSLKFNKSFTPKPPRKPRLERTSSLDELIWQRRQLFRTSQESLTDAAEVNSNTRSLQGSPPGWLRLASRGNHNHNQEPLCSLCKASETPHTGQGQLGLSDSCEKMSLCNKQLAKVMSSHHPPSLELDGSFPGLRTANRIDLDCADYRPSSHSFCARASSSWSDTKLHSRGMVCDNCSTASMKSAFSLLTPLRVRDVRSR